MDKTKLYIQKAQARLDQYQAKYDELVAKSKESGVDANLAIKKRIKNLEMRFNEAKKQFQAFKSANQEAQPTLLERINLLLDNIRDEINN